MKHNWNAYLKTAIEAASASGKVLMRKYGKLNATEVHQKGGSDWVTAVDHASEKAILKILKKAYPDHAIQAEESSPDKQQGDFQWFIDPLDGTVNYLHGFPMFCNSIAMSYQGDLKIAVIFDPTRNEMFTAVRGKGARLNGKRFYVTQRTQLRESLICTGFPFKSKEPVVDAYMQSFRAVFKRSGWIRRPGSAALDLAYAACGRAEAFWEICLNPWDIAAGALLVEEAGGVVTDLLGGETYLHSGHIVAGNPSIQKQLLKLVKPCLKDWI